jgi:hypothetical protein
MRHSLARSASETVLETAPSLVALADLHVQASAIRKRFASIEMSEHLMREAIRGSQRPSEKEAPFGLNGLGDEGGHQMPSEAITDRSVHPSASIASVMREAIRCHHRRTHPSASMASVMRETIRCHQRQSQKDAPFGLNSLGDEGDNQMPSACHHRSVAPFGLNSLGELLIANLA